MAVLILYLVFRSQVSSLLLVLLVVVLTPIPGIAIALFLAYVLYALLGTMMHPRAVRAPARVLRR